MPVFIVISGSDSGERMLCKYKQHNVVTASFTIHLASNKHSQIVPYDLNVGSKRTKPTSLSPL